MSSMPRRVEARRRADADLSPAIEAALWRLGGNVGNRRLCKAEGIFACTGHGPHGISPLPGTIALLGALIFGKKPCPIIAAWRVNN